MPLTPEYRDILIDRIDELDSVKRTDVRTDYFGQTHIECTAASFPKVLAERLNRGHLTLNSCRVCMKNDEPMLDIDLIVVE